MTATEQAELVRIQEWIVKLLDNVERLCVCVQEGEVSGNYITDELLRLHKELDDAQGALWELARGSEEVGIDRVNELEAVIVQYHIHKCDNTGEWAQRCWSYGDKGPPLVLAGWRCDVCRQYRVDGHCQLEEAAQ